MKILVTGAGGSIGSALCKALQQHELVLYEMSEFALYRVNEELVCRRKAILGDVKDFERLRHYMAGVDVVYHCAAYKHVPLLEGDNESQAWANNVEGTRVVMEAGIKVPRIVLLSTDKAIRPAGAMGRSKKMAELIARRYGRTVARLGNVLESSGSVIPKFRQQIANGGPVTVTHPDATRYFIPMEQATAFLINCSTRAPGTYMVDMGAPVRILDLAKQMIGERDIPIEFTGLRPGEKLHEDLKEAA